ncbi:hypothetical protein D3879_06500 [Pseudomonas cavernicola]|uniref:Uncharacterized protein n=1 Tax=Pseudomonas cavernicola TaxID=2320866 RepID=A0A418XKB9_9PSED|nr:hypothetical protein [Pseudomonas cavernicola]RJG12923.1 hypothetical protein D3879_06500 [Pseudomonas cavernicola]
MSRLIVEFLNDSLLFDITLIRESYRDVPNVRLVQELLLYREHCTKNLHALTLEIKKEPEILSCLGSPDMGKIECLKRSALYLEQIVLACPIFPFSEPEHQFSNTMSEYMGLDKSSEIDKEKLARAVKYVLDRRPMIAGGFVKFYPVSYHTELSIEIPITYSESGYADLLPETILELYQRRSEALSLKKTRKGLLVEEDLYPCRSIFVRFKGLREAYVYNLLQQKVIESHDETRVMTVAMHEPAYPPTTHEFEHWVSESVNRSALAHFKSLTQELGLANRLGSVYSTSSNLNNEILRAPVLNSQQGIREHTLDCVLRMNLPYMDKISAEDLMSLRLNDGEEFKSFRVELEKQFRELRSETDPSTIKKRIEDVEHELTVVQVRSVQEKIKSVRKSALADVGVAVSGVAAGFATSGFSVLGALAGLLHGCKTYIDYQEKVKGNPCYFLWNLKKHQKPTSPVSSKRKQILSQAGRISNVKPTDVSAFITPKQS